MCIKSLFDLDYLTLIPSVLSLRLLLVLPAGCWIYSGSLITTIIQASSIDERTKYIYESRKKNFIKAEIREQEKGQKENREVGSQTIDAPFTVLRMISSVEKSFFKLPAAFL